MTTISVDDIQRDPDGYLRRVERGETFLILRDKHPVAEIKPANSQPRDVRPFGLARGEFTVPRDFNDPLPANVLRDFEGE